MIRPALSPGPRETMGLAAIRRAAGGAHDRGREIDRLLEIHAETIDRHASKGRRPEVAAPPVGSARR